MESIRAIAGIAHGVSEDSTSIPSTHSTTAVKILGIFINAVTRSLRTQNPGLNLGLQKSGMMIMIPPGRHAITEG
jgi:hypothetical protein